MSQLAQLYRAQFRTTFADQVQYRGALAIWAINLILEPVIYLAVWSSVAASQGGVVDGLGPRDFAAYFIAIMVVNHASVTWIMWEFEFWIRQGSLSPRLLRPVHPIHQTIADNLTFKFLNLIVVLPAATVLALVFHANFAIAPWALVAFVPALLLAAALRFAIEWTLALSAFWITRVGAINQLYFVVFLFLSGQMAPLALLPGPVATLAAWLPFYRTLGFPVELLLGHLTLSEALWGVGAQAAWLAIFVIALNVLWTRGVRQYAAVGA